MKPFNPFSSICHPPFAKIKQENQGGDYQENHRHGEEGDAQEEEEEEPFENYQIICNALVDKVQRWRERGEGLAWVVGGKKRRGSFSYAYGCKGIGKAR